MHTKLQEYIDYNVVSSFGYLNPTQLNAQLTITFSTKPSLSISGLSNLYLCEFLEPLQPDSLLP